MKDKPDPLTLLASALVNIKAALEALAGKHTDQCERDCPIMVHDGAECDPDGAVDELLQADGCIREYLGIKGGK